MKQQWQQFIIRLVLSGTITALSILVTPRLGMAANTPNSAPETGTVVQPTEVYLVPVDGPNLTTTVPPLDRSRAIPLHQSTGPLAGEVPGQWYDHYAYYDLGGTRVEQYTNFQETSTGQFIAVQRWNNNNGGSDRWLQDGWTGSTYDWLVQWLSGNPVLSPNQEYTQDYGTMLRTNFRATASGCPCWTSEYAVGSH